MSTLPNTNISNGQQASAGALNQDLASIQSQGTAILDLLSEIQLDTLVQYSQRLTDLQSKQQRAARVQAADIACLFVVSDFNDIDQGRTTATVRIDAASATLRERRIPTTALVTSTAFSASSGTVAALNADQTLLSVFADITPTGTFTLELQESVNISVMTLDLVSMVSNPDVIVQVSSNGLVYTPAAQVILNGSTLNAWFPAQDVQFIQIILTPSAPDNLGGNSYTFGITDFSATTVSYNLVSDVYFRPITFSTFAQQLIFRAEDTGGVTYYLQLNVGNWAAPSYTPVADGDVISIPGVTSTTLTGQTINMAGFLSTSLPFGVHENSIVVTDETTGQVLETVDNISGSDPNLSRLTGPYASVSTGSLIWIAPPPTDITHTYKVSFLTGPTSVTASLIAHLSTTDRNQTPIFKGASLEEF